MINILLAYLPQLTQGVLLTLILTLASLSIGLGLAILMVTCHLSENYFFKKMITMFVFFIRGTPLLVQLFLIYYGIAQFYWIRESFIWFIFRSPMACAIIALSFNTACYSYILLLGAINSVPNNEIAATKALGMSKWLAMRRIILPRAFRIMLPAYSNEVILILKSTSLASTITLMDIMGVIQHLISQTYNTITFYMIAGILYLGLNSIIILVFKMLQHQYSVVNLKEM